MLVYQRVIDHSGQVKDLKGFTDLFFTGSGRLLLVAKASQRPSSRMKDN
jgi:hypothetical protein